MVIAEKGSDLIRGKAAPAPWRCRVAALAARPSSGSWRPCRAQLPNTPGADRNPRGRAEVKGAGDRQRVVDKKPEHVLWPWRSTDVVPRRENGDRQDDEQMQIDREMEMVLDAPHPQSRG